jgi:hypothetical protein
MLMMTEKILQISFKMGRIHLALVDFSSIELSFNVSVWEGVHYLKKYALN